MVNDRQIYRSSHGFHGKPFLRASSASKALQGQHSSTDGGGYPGTSVGQLSSVAGLVLLATYSVRWNVERGFESGFFPMKGMYGIFTPSDLVLTSTFLKVYFGQVFRVCLYLLKRYLEHQVTYMKTIKIN